MRNLCIQFAVILQFLTGTIAENTCGPSFTIPGFKLYGLVIKTVTKISKENCQTNCTSNKNCKSVNFHLKHRKCELNHGNHLTNPEYLRQEDGFVYLDNHMSISSGAEICSKHFCSDSLECVMKGSGRYDCLPCRKGNHLQKFTQ